MSTTTAGLGAREVAALLGRPMPTEEQVSVIEAPMEPLLVVAGAGSGKTETMAARVVHLIANGYVEPDGVLGLTFTRKAAGELSERVRHRLRALRRRTGGGRASALAAPTISTYNSYAATLVGDHAVRLGLEPSARLLGEAARWQLAHEVVERWTGDLDVDLAPSTVTQAVLDLAGALAEHLREPEDLRVEAERLVAAVEALPPGEGLRGPDRNLLRDVVASLRLRARLADLVVEFTQRKRRSESLDFADQVALAARLARTVPDVGAGERSRFAVVLLDEYQDTSVAQLELLRHLYGGAGPGIGHAVTAVGDPHQSIYGWRGASAGGLGRFPHQFPVDGGASGQPRPARVLALATSWRNDRAVLAAANVVAGPLREGSAADAAPRPAVSVLQARPDAGTGEVTCLYLESQDEEARIVAERIHAAWTAGREAGDPVTAAVLCRKRSQLPLLHTALSDRGLPVEVVGLGGLLGTPEIVDLVAALEAAHDPSRGDSLMRLLVGPRARLGLADLHALADWSAELARAQAGAAGAAAGAAGDQTGWGPRDPAADGLPATPASSEVPASSDAARDLYERSIVDAVDELPRPGWTSTRGRSLTEVGRRRLADLRAVLRALRAQTSLPVVDLVVEAERLLGLDIEVAARPGRSPAGARANLDAFRAVAAGFSDVDDLGTLGAFLAWLDAAQREERGLEAPVAEVDPDAVQLLTVHAAKGLEWDVVAVPGLVDGGFPAIRIPADGVPRDPGWLTDRGTLPSTLRGDRDSLPHLDLTGAPDMAALAARCAEYRAACGAHEMSEERRLAYVALTRARRQLLLTGSWWRAGSTPQSPSVFLTELAPEGAEKVEGWAPDPSAGSQDGKPSRPVRPDGASTEPPVWPSRAALGVRQAAVDRAARAVTSAREGPRAGAEARPVGPSPAAWAGTHGAPDGGGAGRLSLSLGDEGTPADHSTVSDLAVLTDLLLEEQRRGAERRSTVALPSHLSASALVRLARDPAAFAVQLRRPVPLPPSANARRGTAFHAWVERYYGSAALVDVDSLPGADDDSVPADADLAALRATFLTSTWASMVPEAIEVDVETAIGGLQLRSRIDAVFPDSARPGGVVVLDWKTGRPPDDPASAAHRELQLSVYRLAWSRWTERPVEQVSAAFFYVATGQTVRPSRLLSAEEIEELVVASTVAGGRPGD